MKRELDHQATSITIRTRAKGLLSRLAHDLEIEASRIDADVEVDGDTWEATMRFDVSGLRVVGALKGDKVDRAVLSSSDKDEIERKIRAEVLLGREVVVTCKGSNHRRADVTVEAPRGRQTVSANLETEQRPGGEVVTRGQVPLSLKRLGVPEVKAPLGAFKVDDRIEIHFWVMLDKPEG